MGPWLVALGVTLAFYDAVAAESDGLKLLQTHIAFVESTYQKWLYFGGAVMAVLLGLATFLGIRTKRDVKDLVDRRFEAEADRRIRAKVEEFMAMINEEVRPKIAELQKLIDDLGKAVDEHMEQADKAVDGSADAIAQVSQEINDLRDAVSALQSRAEIPEAERVGPRAMADDEREERDGLLWDRMLYALNHHKFVWRSIERLALAAGTTPQEAERILRAHSGEVVVSRGKSGRTIARHVNRMPT